MNLPAALFIGLRYSNSRKSNHFIAFINWFSIAGIALGLMALVITTSVMNGFEGQLKDRILGLSPHFLVNQASLPDAITQSPVIIGSTPFAEVEAVVQGSRALKPIYLQGIEPASFTKYAQINQHMQQGSLELLAAGNYQIAIGRALAIQLDLSVGDQLRVILAGTSIFTPFGRVPAQRKFEVSGIFDMGSELDDKVALIHLADLARLKRTNVASMQQARLFLQDPFEFPVVRQLLDDLDLQYVDWRERQGPLFDAVKMEKNMMVVMLMLIIAVAAFNIISALVMVVNEKQGDIAILRTQGMPRRNVMYIFMINGLLNGLKGTVIGLVLGLLVTTQLNPVMHALQVPIMQYLPEGEVPIALQPGQIAAMVLLTLALSFLASLYPAWRALRVKPADALRYE